MGLHQVEKSRRWEEETHAMRGRVSPGEGGLREGRGRQLGVGEAGLRRVPQPRRGARRSCGWLGVALWGRATDQDGGSGLSRLSELVSRLDLALRDSFRVL